MEWADATINAIGAIMSGPSHFENRKQVKNFLWKKMTQNMRNNLFWLLSVRAGVRYASCRTVVLVSVEAWKKIAAAAVQCSLKFISVAKISSSFRQWLECQEPAKNKRHTPPPFTIRGYAHEIQTNDNRNHIRSARHCVCVGAKITLVLLQSGVLWTDQSAVAETARNAL